MITDKQIQRGREIIRKYVADDGLKPEYNGMTAWEISKMILEAVEVIKTIEIGMETARKLKEERERCAEHNESNCEVCK